MSHIFRSSVAGEQQQKCWIGSWQLEGRSRTHAERPYYGRLPPAEATDLRRTRSRQPPTGRARQQICQVPAALAVAEREVLRTFASGSHLLAEFLEYGVCREQYFTEVSLRGELAAEARLVAEALEERTFALDPATVPTLQSPLPWQDDEGFPAEQHLAPASEDCFDLQFRAKHLSAAQQRSSKPLAKRRKGTGKVARSSEPSGVKSSPEARRKARRAKWQQYAVTGALAGVEAGAIELAAKRRARAHLPSATASRTDLSPKGRLQSSQPQRDTAELDSALDLLLGRQGHVLDRQEELQLVQEMQAGLAIFSAVEELKAEHSRCPTAAELTTRLGASLDAISDTLSRGLRAKHALLHANKRLVFKLAHSFGFDRRVPYEEYVLAGMEGLVKGLLKFDPSRGHKLSSLLVWWIRASISSLATALNSIVYMPKKVQYSLHALSRKRRQLMGQLGRKPSIEELCEAMGMPLREVQRLLAAERRSTVQLEDLVSSTSGSSQMAKAWGGGETEADLSQESMLRASEDDTPSGMLRRQSLEDFLDGQISKLPGRDAHIVRSLYGLRKPPSSTSLQKQVALEFGVTPKRISQIKLQVLHGMRQSHAELLQQAVTSF